MSLLGCGWLGIALAHTLNERGVHVRGSTTHSSRLGLLSSIGIEPYLLRIEPGSPGETSGVGAFFSSETLVIDLPPEIAFGRDFHPGQIEVILSMLGNSIPKQIVYVSSTSVYSNEQGTVDESVVPLPTGDSGEVLVKVEEMLRSFARANQIGLTIIRPGGLIGPGRHPGLFLAGRKGLVNGSAPVNMVHQLELSDWITSLIADHPVKAGDCEVYNAVSSHHPTREEFYTRMALSIGVQPPTFVLEASIGGKVVLSEKIRRVTAVAPRFSDLYASMGSSK